jgi:thiol-disulfide isomerase/thioredoxin
MKAPLISICSCVCVLLVSISLFAQKKDIPTLAPPFELIGNWFTTSGGEWTFGFYDKHAIYRSNVWSYTEIQREGKTLIITLKNGDKVKTIFAIPGNKGNFLLGEDGTKLTAHSKVKTESAAIKMANDASFDLPVLKDDSSVYKGYVKGYKPDCGFTVGQITVTNSIYRNESFSISILKDGTFEVKVPLVHPGWAKVILPGVAMDVFLEPGKELFQLIDRKEQLKIFSSQKVLFMGECARINYEFMSLKTLIEYDEDDLRFNIIDLTPEEFKKYVFDVRNQKLDQFAEYKRTHVVSAKGNWFIENSIRLNAFVHVSNYNSISNRAVYSIPANENKVNVEGKWIRHEPSFFSFMKELPLNDARYLMIKNYDRLIESIQNSGILYSPSMDSLVTQSLKASNILNEREQRIMDTLMSLKDAQYSLYISTRSMNKTTITSAINSKFDSLKKVMATFATRNKEEIIKIDEFKNKEIDRRKQGLIKDYFDLEAGLVTDLIKSKTLAYTLESYNPFSDKQVAMLQNEISTPFITAILLKYNESLKREIDRNKKNAGFVSHEMPKVKVDSIFEGIIRNYKGKTVFIDFWATWCGPCKLGMEKMKPLKEELSSNKDIAFVYITDESSPLLAYQNVITMIPGEHYRVSKEAWQVLAKKFSIASIPHYMIVNKKGEVEDAYYHYRSNYMLKRRLSGDSY